MQFTTGNLDDFEVTELTLVGGEADERAHLMPALQTGSAGIDMQQVQLLVVLNLENVAVATDEELGRTGVELVADAPIVATGISSDVRHQDVCALAVPSQFLGIHQTEVTSVAVADDSTQRTELGQPLGYFHAADVAGMPYLVALGKVFEVFRVPVGVGVGKEANAFHDRNEIKETTELILFLFVGEEGEERNIGGNTVDGKVVDAAGKA